VTTQQLRAMFPELYKRSPHPEGNDIACSRCNKIKARGQEAQRFRQQLSALEISEHTARVKEKTQALTALELETPPRCSFCHDDQRALERPGLKPDTFATYHESYTPDINGVDTLSTYACNKCGLRMDYIRPDLLDETSWELYFNLSIYWSIA